MTETEPATKIDRRTLGTGRAVGRGTYKVYKWEVTMFDKETSQLKQGKFCSLAHINREWDLKLTCDLAHRIQTNYRADMTAKRGKNSFLQKYGHIKLHKISEPVGL
jgi:hypothetical protein